MILEGSEPCSGALLVAFAVKVHCGPSRRKPVRSLFEESFQSLERKRSWPAASIQSSFGPATTSTVQVLLVEKLGRQSALILRPARPAPLPTGTTCPAFKACPSMPPTPALWKVEREPSQGGVSMPPAIAI